MQSDKINHFYFNKDVAEDVSRKKNLPADLCINDVE